MDCSKLPGEQRKLCEESGPRLSERLHAFGRSAINFVAARAEWEAAGRPIVPKEIQDYRRIICNNCDQRDSLTDKCKVCGCPLHSTSLGDKLAWATEECPIKKWLSVPEDKEIMENEMKPPKWVYGVTTVLGRLETTLPKTLVSLREAGFGSPRLFIDGSHLGTMSGLETTHHYPNVKVHGNWILAMMELLIREPNEQAYGSNRYAMFQDDLIASKNLREYLDRCKFPEKGYWNLYTFPENQSIVPVRDGVEYQGWYLSNQMGKSALGLVFNREGLLTLLSSRKFVERPLAATRGTDNVDGGISVAMTQAGYQEWVHNPSLLQHTGDITSKDRDSGPHPKATSFRGENFDCMELLKCKETPSASATK